MKNSIAVKFIAFALCALSLVAAVGSAAGIVLTEAYGLYNDTLENKQDEKLDQIANELAWYYAQQHAAETLGNCPWDMTDYMFSTRYIYTLSGKYTVELYLDGQLVDSSGSAEGEDLRKLEWTVTSSYPIMSSQYTIDEYGQTTETVPAATEPAADIPAAASFSADSSSDKKLLYSSSYHEDIWDDNGDYQGYAVYTVDYYQGPEYQVTVYLSATPAPTAELSLMELLYKYRSSYIPVLLIGLLVFAVTLVYLCVCAGRTSDGEIRPSGLNRIPLDLYLLVAGGGIAGLIVPFALVIDSIYDFNVLADNMQLCMLICGLCATAIAILLIGFIFAFAAQAKVRGGYWWRHSITGWFLRQVSKFFRWIGKGFCWIGRGCRAVFRLLPVIWQWLLMAGIMAGVTVLFGLLSVVTWSYTQLLCMMLLFVSILLCIIVVCYGGWCFGTLMKGARAMAQGDLNHQIPTQYMLGAFRDFGTQLNNLAGAAQVAAEKQLKSERMKTELITNVSHDIKTPLTSIINFVDLLKKPHTEEEGRQYLEVLDRQSLRLKKLIDDLMEMSKASTGNLSVELGQVNAAEAVNQALGEFADKLDAARLTPVFRYPDEPVTMLADGRLVWRVLSNVLSNAVKYALPDTRLYIDLMVLQGNAVLAIKNISRDQLNVNADELMERFVRGDTSRNTEGSGLGLNIAKSLVELQKGQMHLMVDGDLFKVTLIFPLA